ncbi:hypothetical protein P3G55_23995 [Leptospira sp. 96542]|nr:hypothetical protein [Leptospira sp. 96542]
MPPAVGQFSHDAGGCSFEYNAILFLNAFISAAASCSGRSVGFTSNLGGGSFIHNGGGGRSDACDVLQPEEPRTATVGNVEDVEEEPGAFAIEARTLARQAEVLAREARNDSVHCAIPASSVESE